MAVYGTWDIVGHAWCGYSHMLAARLQGATSAVASLQLGVRYLALLGSRLIPRMTYPRR